VVMQCVGMHRRNRAGEAQQLGTRPAKNAKIQSECTIRTFSVYDGKPIFCDREISQCIDSSDVRKWRDRKILSRREGLMTDLGLVLKRVQARDDPRKFLVWWRGLFLVSQTSRTQHFKWPDIRKSSPTGCKLGTAMASSPDPE
jgi:hypothetical protein